MSMFKAAERTQSKLRLALCGVPGSGKTYSALAIATALGKKVAVIDTEGGKHGSANKYGSGDPFSFDFITIADNFHPQRFIDAIHDAEKAGYDVLIIDSLTHAWTGKGGVLDQADMAAKRQRGGNSFTAWKEATPLHRALIDAILQSSIHIIGCMRSKMSYEIETNERGKKAPKKLGLAPIQRDDVTYEFDIVADMVEGEMIVNKSRCSILDKSGQYGGCFKHPGADVAKLLDGWLNTGIEQPKESFVPAEVSQVMDGTMEVPEPPADPKPEPQPVPEPEPEAPKRFKYLDLIDKAVATPDAPSIWNEEVARKLGYARNSLSKHLERYNGHAVTDTVTRSFLKAHFGIHSHKNITQPMMDAMMEWMRECYNQNKVLV